MIHVRIKKVMKQQKVTCKELSEVSGVSPGQMSRYLNGKSKMPYGIVSSSLAHLGYDLLIVLK